VLIDESFELQDAPAMDTVSMNFLISKSIFRAMDLGRIDSLDTTSKNSLRMNKTPLQSCCLCERTAGHVQSRTVG